MVCAQDTRGAYEYEHCLRFFSVCLRLRPWLTEASSEHTWTRQPPHSVLAVQVTGHSQVSLLFLFPYLLLSSPSRTLLSFPFLSVSYSIPSLRSIRTPRFIVYTTPNRDGIDPPPTSGHPRGRLLRPAALWTALRAARFDVGRYCIDLLTTATDLGLAVSKQGHCSAGHFCGSRSCSST